MAHGTALNAAAGNKIQGVMVRCEMLFNRCPFTSAVVLFSKLPGIAGNHACLRVFCSLHELFVDRCADASRLPPMQAIEPTLKQPPVLQLMKLAKH